MLCQYKDIFGKEGQGIHSIRIPIPGIKGGIALVDTLLTFLVAYMIGRYYHMKPFNIFSLFIVLMILSIVIHKAFCVDTALSNLF